jgi:hypothetical protein
MPTGDKNGKKSLKIKVQKNNETHKGFLCVSSCSVLWFFYFFLFLLRYTMQWCMQCAGTWRKGAPMLRIRNLSFVFVREMPFCDKQSRRNVSGREDWSSPYFGWWVNPKIQQTAVFFSQPYSNRGSWLCSPQKLFPTDFFFQFRRTWIRILFSIPWDGESTYPHLMQSDALISIKKN